MSGASKGDNSCTAAVAAELDAKKFLSRLYRSEFWGKCVKVNVNYSGSARPHKGILLFVAYPGQDPKIDQVFMFHAPMSTRDMLFSLKQGDRITVIGRVWKSSYGDIATDPIMVHEIDKRN